MDRDDIRPRRDGVQVSKLERDDNIEVVPHPELTTYRAARNGADHPDGDGVGGRVVDELDGIEVLILRGSGSRAPLATESAELRRPESARMNFVPPLIGRLPLDDAIRAFELGERAHAGSVGVNEIGVMGDVGDELGAGIAKSGDPLGPRRAHELNDPQALAIEALRSRTSWVGAGARFGIDGTAVQQDEAVLVHGLDRRMAD